MFEQPDGNPNETGTHEVRADLNPRERHALDERIDRINRHHHWFGAGWLLLILLLAAAAWYVYPIVSDHQAALTRFTDVQKAIDSAGSQVKQTAEKVEQQASDQENLHNQVTQLGRTVQAKMEAAAKQARESSTEFYDRVQSQINQKFDSMETRLGHIESSSASQQTQIADLEQQLGQTRREIAAQAGQINAVRQQIEQTGTDHERQIANLKQTEESDRHDVDSIEHKLAVRRVDFEVNKNHSSELSDGISLGVTKTDPVHRTISGWVWVATDRRTIWLKGQSAQTPVILYGYSDGRRRELVITNVTDRSATGYMLLPADNAVVASVARP
jgi:predicted  nucleic acid-binding Zn-ribbon protein